MRNNPFSLDGQVALITGGGSGLGLATAHALVEAGARVVLTGRRAGPLADAVGNLGSAASYVEHDVSDLDSIPALVAQVADTVADPDILVNNAGIHLKKSALDTSDDELQAVMQTHLLGAFALSRECGRRMVARGRGSILLISSMAALMAIPQVAAYTVAKTAVLGLMHALVAEYSPHGVRVNTIAPGWIDTAMVRNALAGDPERAQRVLERTPLGRLGEPMDVGHSAVFLCSPAAQFITGVVLPVDGGASIGF